MKRSLVLIALGGLLLWLVALPSPTSAAPTGACYLTTAASSMTLDTALANPYCVNINLAAGTYHADGVSFARDVVITGAGSKKTTIDGGGAGRIFSFTGAGSTFVISGVTLKNGYTAGNGGAIYSTGKLFVTDATFSGNGAYQGGAITAVGPLTSIQRSTFKANTGSFAAGAIYADAVTTTIDGSTFDGNTAPAAGAVGSPGGKPLDITNSTFKNNRATGGDGGAVYASGPTDIASTTFTNNRATGSGGAVYVYAGTTTIKLSTFSGNLAVNYGGGVANNGGNLVINTSSLSNNSAYWGGGVGSPTGAAQIETSLFEKNKAQVTTLAPIAAALPSSSPWRRELKQPAAPTGDPAGGGLYAWTTAVVNTTFSGNTTTGRGGGVYAFNYVDTSFSTFSKNTAATAGGSFYTAGIGDVSFLRNNIFDKGGPDNCAGTAAPGGFMSMGNNLSSDHSCDSWFIASDLKAVNPKLSGLAKNGGPTKTHATQTGSPAIHGAPTCKNAYGIVVLIDQRLYQRPTPNVVGTPCDIGAYEHK